MVTKCDKGGAGSKIGGRPVTYFLNGPLIENLNKVSQCSR